MQDTVLVDACKYVARWSARESEEPVVLLISALHHHSMLLVDMLKRNLVQNSQIYTSTKLPVNSAMRLSARDTDACGTNSQ